MFEVNGILEKVMPTRKVKSGRGKVQDIVLRMTSPDNPRNLKGSNKILLQVFNEYISSSTLNKLEGQRVRVRFYLDCKVKELPDNNIRWWNNAICNNVEVL